MKILVVAGMLLLGIGTHAAGGDVPDVLQALVAAGLKNNLGLQIQKLQIAQQKEQSLAESAQFDSVIHGGMGFERSATPYESASGFSGNLDSNVVDNQVGVSKRLSVGTELNALLSSQWVDDNDFSNDLNHRYRTSLVLEINQPLLKGLGRAANMSALNISRNQERQESLNYLLLVQDYLLQLESSFWQFVYRQEQVALRSKSLRLAQELLAGNHKKHTAGLVAVTEVQEAETAVADRELSLSQALQQRDVQREVLGRLINSEIPENRQFLGIVDPGAPPDVTELPPLVEMLTAAFERRLEFKISDYDIANVRLRTAARKNALQPQLDLNLKGGIMGLAGDDRGTIAGSRYQGGFGDALGDMSEADGYQWRIGLTFSMPFEQREGKARLNQSRQQLRQARYRREDLALQVRAELAEQAIQVERAREQLDIAERFAELARISLDQEARRLQEGLSNTFRMISFQEKMVEAELGQIQALVNYYQSLAQLTYARGNTFSRYQLVMVDDAEELSFENL